MTEEKFPRNLLFFLLQDAERNFTHSAPKDDTIMKWKQNCTSRKTTAKEATLCARFTLKKNQDKRGVQREKRQMETEEKEKICRS